MESELQVIISIEFSDREIELEQLEHRTLQLMQELKKIEDLTVMRVRDLKTPTGHKSVGGFLVGILKAEVTLKNAKKAIGFLDRYFIGKPNQPITVKAEADGKKIEIETANINDFKEVIGEMNKFFAQLSTKN